jgi:acyl carrier protein
MDAEQAQQALGDALSRIAPEVDVRQVDPSADLREEVDLDSMDFLAFVVRLSESTGIEIREDDYPRLRTLDESVDFLVRQSGTLPRR